MTTWNLYLRNAALQRIAEIEDYQSLEVVRRFNDVGAFTLSMDVRAEPALLLTEPGMGITLVRDDSQVIMSGPILSRKRSRDVKLNRLELSGADDNIWLKWRLAHPQPLSAAPPYNADAYDVRTNVCNQVLREYVDANLGPNALATRRHPQLVFPGLTPLGSTITGRARWQNLLVLLKELALTGGGVGFDLRQSGTTLSFETYMPIDRSATVQFSVELGNLFKHDYSVEAPEMTYVFVAAGGEGTARTMKEGYSAEQAIWGRIEGFKDRRDTVDAIEMQQSIDEELLNGKSKVTLDMEPIDIPGQQYKTHYDLGDKVSVAIDDVIVQELIREVKIELSAKGPQRVIPKVGTPGDQSVISLFRRLRNSETRIRDLERR